jgi:hypothetical protein
MTITEQPMQSACQLARYLPTAWRQDLCLSALVCKKPLTRIEGEKPTEDVYEYLGSQHTSTALMHGEALGMENQGTIRAEDFDIALDSFFSFLFGQLAYTGRARCVCEKNRWLILQRHIRIL